MAYEQQQTNNQQRLPPERPKPKGPIGKLFGIVFGFVSFLVSSLLIAIVVEWVGMVFFWPEEGTHHSRLMMEMEIHYLADDFRTSLFASSPSEFARQFSSLFYYYLVQWTGFEDALLWLSQTPPKSDGVQSTLHEVYVFIEPYALAAIMVIQTYSLRLAVLVLSLPCFALFGAVGFADGLMRRDLRRWGGGRESSVAHHYAKRTALPLLFAPWIVYLGLPVSVHPNWVILPCAIAFGVSLCVTSATFKKYL